MGIKKEEKMKKLMKKILLTRLILEEFKRNLGYSYLLFTATGIFCLLTFLLCTVMAIGKSLAGTSNFLAMDYMLR
ncbi:hypothetical protein DYE50_07010 [Treponema ruminis]|nr:hypothetical protein DYE50_07010 [Treponema ruminis]